MQPRQGSRTLLVWSCWLSVACIVSAVLAGLGFIVGAKEPADLEVRPTPRPAVRRVTHIRQQPEASAAPLAAKDVVVRTYDVADVLARFRDEVDANDGNARKVVAGIVKSSTPGPWKISKLVIADLSKLEDAPPPLREALLANESAMFTLDWAQDKLVVAQSAAGHSRIERQLEALRSHGFSQVVVEVRILSGPAAALEGITTEWKLFGTTTVASPAPIGPDEFDAQPQSSDNTSAAATFSIERQLPAMQALLDDGQVKRLLNKAQNDTHTNIFAPQVLVFNGQSAEICDVTQRPVVAGVKPADEDALAPQIQLLSEGTTIRVRPELADDERVKLDIAVTLSDIRSVDTGDFRLGQVPGRSPLVVQLPELGILRIRTSGEMDLSKTLAVGVPSSTKGKNDSPMCLLVTARKKPLGAEGAAP